MVAPRRNDQVAVVAYDGLATLEYAIPIEVFGLPRPELARYYQTITVGAEAGPLRGGYGLSIEAQHNLSVLATVGTIVLPGWHRWQESPPKPLLEALCNAHDQGARLLSICSGAFVLAATGLLDGRRATTHWMYAKELRARYPLIDVDESALYVDEGTIITGAGSAAGIDACLHLVRQDWGRRTANVVARRMVVSPHREGGQAQFISAPMGSEHAVADRTVAALMARLIDTLHQPHSVESMAADLCVSPRTLSRRFQAAAGISPMDWLTRQRVYRACALLEESELAIEAIADAAGFGSASSLRQQFQRRMQLSPSAYRRRFGAVADHPQVTGHS